MAQTASATLKSNAASATRVIAVELLIAWGRDADDWPTDWAAQATNETTRLLDVSVDRNIDINALTGRGRGPVAQMRLTLSNHDQRYSPYNEAGDLYASLTDTTTTAGGTTVRYPKLWMTPVRLRMGFVDSIAGSEYVTVFSGVIDEPSENYGIDGDRIILTCLDRGAVLLEKKASSAVGINKAASSWINNLVELYGDITDGVYDRGFAVLPYSWLDEEPLWSEIQDVAAADGGFAFFDETGIFRYKNAAWWAVATDSTTSQATISTRFQVFTPEYSYRNVATGVLVEYSPRAPGGEQIIWRSDSTIVVPPEGTTLTARFQYATVGLLDLEQPKDWIPSSSGGLDMSEYVTVTFSDTAAQSTVITFANTSSQTAFIPSMQLRGLALVGGPQEQVDVEIASPLVPDHKITIAGNIYMQTKQQAELIANLNAYRMSYPRLVHRFDGVPALPWLQLGDRITIDVAAPVTSDRYGIITALGLSWQPEGPFTMNIEAIDVAGLYEYDNYHVLGTTQYGSGVAFL